MVDINKLLDPVSPEAPCGEDLEYDSGFLDLVKSATYVPPRKMGNHEIPAVEPVWSEVREKAETLLGKSKDLRIAVLLSKALLYQKGFEGFSTGLEILKSLIEKFWDSVHPLPDPDDNDMTMRLNALSDLEDYDSILRKISELPLITVRGLGSFGLKSVEEAKQNPALKSEIDAALIKADPKKISKEESFIAKCINHINVIQKIFPEKAEKKFHFDTLSSSLAKARSFLSDQILKSGGNTSLTDAPDSTEESGGITDQSVLPIGQAVPLAAISSPNDVKRTIDMICDYYDKNEPSSPVPLLLLRAKGLVSKSFMEILEDISPEGAKQVKVLKGSGKQP